MKCCFTGHRNLPRGAELNQLKSRLITEVERAILRGYDTFIAGGAVGFDMLAGFSVLELKQKYQSISLHIMLPCPEYDKFWDEDSKARQRKLLSLADSHTFVSKGYFKQCMFVRNRAMVDNSTMCIAYYNENNATGGTAQTIRYAKGCGLEIVLI